MFNAMFLLVNYPIPSTPFTIMSLTPATIILNFFGHQDSLKCINSIRAELRTKIFLVDNSASEKEKKKLGHLFNNNPDITILYPEENLGFAAGVNLGLKAAINSGFCHFFIINNDAQLVSGSGPCLQTLSRKHKGSIIAPVILWKDDNVKGLSYHKYLGILSGSKRAPAFGWCYYFTGCALIMDIEALQRNGFFDEAFFMYGEDVEYCHRAKRMGVPLVLLEEELVRHDGSKSSKNASFFFEYHVNRGHFLLITRLLKNPLARSIAFLGKGGVLTARVAWRTLKYQSIAPSLGFFLAPFKLHIRPKR